MGLSLLHWTIVANVVVVDSPRYVTVSVTLGDATTNFVSGSPNHLGVMSN